LPEIRHEFGSQSTEIKLALIEQYLKAYTTALSNTRWQLIYFDAFAGTGERTYRTVARDGDLLDESVEERVEQRRGSARIALEVNPQFDILVFMERNKRYCEALNLLKAQNPTRKIHVIQGDCNEAIRDLTAKIDWRKNRAVMFLDPYGMNVEWATLQAIAKTEAIDVWYLFSLSGLFRQAALNIESIDQDKRAALTRTLGTDEWEKSLYQTTIRRDLWGNDIQQTERNADVVALERYVSERLSTLFPKVLKPLALPIDKKPQMFSLYFLISNPSPPAMGLATKIANHILKVGNSSQVRSR
jgi:three-Cys-motif partner protein